MKKRVLCLILAMMMLMSLLPASALAEEAALTDELVGDGVLDVPVILSGESEANAVEGAVEEDSSILAQDDIVEEAPVGDGVPSAPNDEEATIIPVRVEFVCDPEDAVVTVYGSENKDEAGEPLVIEPEEDGSWLLLPGVYFYDAVCEGFETEESQFEIKASYDNQRIEIAVFLKQINIGKEETIESVEYDKNRIKSYSALSSSYNALPDSIGLTQQTDYTCTLAAAAMMLRARMYRSGNEKWTSITESSIQSAAWTTDGLKWSWKYSIDGNTMSVSHKTCSGMTVSSLKKLLDEHSEGVILYDRSKPHAVLACDYAGDTFYCFDPWRGYSGRRILSNSTMSSLGNQTQILSAIDDYWYVSSYSISPSASYALDLNGFLDGVETTDLGDFCTVDVYINGKLELSGVNDYYKVLPAGTTYEFKNLRVKYGRAYDGVDSGSMGGTLSDYQNVRMVFRTIPEGAYGDFKTGTFNGHTYRYYSTPVTWYEANYYSQKLGGHLVTITSEAENSFVFSLCDKTESHIGISRGDDGNLCWVTGESLSYTNWKTGEPYSWWENDERSENYGVFSVNRDGTWNDGAGYYKHGFVCEFDQAPTYVVQYIANGAMNVPSSQIKTHGVALVLSSIKPTCVDSSGGSFTVTLDPNGGSVGSDKINAEVTVSYTFKSWNTAADGSGTRYNPGDSYIMDESATLYALWNARVNVASVTLPTPTRSGGYIFKGWAESPTAASGITGSYTPTDNVTLYAIWDAERYTVNYDANGGTGAPAAQRKTYDEDLTLSNKQPTREGYEFRGWAMDSAAKTAEYLPGDTYRGNEDLILYAVWEKIVVVLELNKNELMLAVNAKEALEANVSGTATDLVWTSSNETVATVDQNGVVTAKKYGKATITVTVPGTNLSASCEVQTLFWDVADSSQYYFRHVYWAAEAGITKGYNLEYFGPQLECTREQMMTFLWRMAKSFPGCAVERVLLQGGAVGRGERHHQWLQFG